MNSVRVSVNTIFSRIYKKVLFVYSNKTLCKTSVVTLTQNKINGFSIEINTVNFYFFFFFKKYFT